MNLHYFENTFLIVSMVVALVLGWVIFQPYLSVFVIAGTLALIFHPIYDRLVKYIHNTSIAALLTVLLVVCIVFIPLAFFGVRIINETTSVYVSVIAHHSLDFTLGINTFIHTHLSSFNLPDISLDINNLVQQGFLFFLNNFGPFLGSIGQFSFSMFLSLLGLFYFLRDGKNFQHFISHIIPLAKEYQMKIVGEIGSMMKSVIESTILMSLIEGILMAIIFVIFNIPNVAFWSSVVAVASLIPIVGVWLVIVPVAGYLFLNGSIVASILFFLISVISMNLVYNLLAPALMHRGNSIHPYVILMSILGGIVFFGPIGFLVGPMIVALIFSLLTIYPNYLAKS